MKRPIHIPQLLLLLCLLLAGFSSTAQTKPFNADIVVAQDGSGDFEKIQAAIDAVPNNSDRRTVIYIKRGLYNTEKLMVPGTKRNVTLIGESREETIISYHIYDCASGKCPTADAAKWTGDNIRTSATLTLQGDGFRAENLTIENTAGPVGQAQAITVKSDKNVFVNCDLKGYQDTIYLWDAGKRTYFENCLIEGRTDYIYGAGIAFFQACEIRSWGGGWITAPSTPRTQTYGYVFNECRLTYATSSPRSGDDGELVRLGRPWHEYPHVVWMNSEMTEKIHPQGWGDTWNMDYAATSPDLKLYEYNNTGPGADMSKRANWVGLRALTAGEAENYTVEKVMAGTDSWNPAAEAPVVPSYNWTGAAATKGWLVAENWNPAAVPATGESATVSGEHEVLADGGSFVADLNMVNGAVLRVTGNSTVTYLSIGGSAIRAAEEVTLAGKISTKEANTFGVTGTLTLDAALAGVHNLTKEGNGLLVLAANNTDYSGAWTISAGTLQAKAANSLGRGSVNISSGATLAIDNDGALQPTSQLRVAAGAALVLNADVTLSEFFIGSDMQAMGEYTATTHPDLISGTGKVIVGRPGSFTFVGGANGNWDNAAHYSPQLLPEAGETVYVNREIETTGEPFPAKMVLQPAGNLRMRGNHAVTGEVEMEAGSRITYATGGTGFSLNAPINVLGDVTMQMSSNNAAGNALTLLGNLRGGAKVTAFNNRNEQVTATLILSGDNSGFSGTWDATRPSSNAASVTRLEGTSAFAFGSGQIEVGANNKVLFSHEKSAGDELKLVTSGTGKAVLNTRVSVIKFIHNGVEMPAGIYTAASHPALFEGPGALEVATIVSVAAELEKQPVRYADKTLYLTGSRTAVTVYSITGAVVQKETSDKAISFKGYKPGLYVARYFVDGKHGSAKVLIRK
ncbi:pectinesterase family protein [Pontibacter beigongshangensis]|uniref:pectinesterase family protein n=1 Tax=Pontibacter beigongshangensis TaxID=2574733 RepID=UPI00164F4976|nr:pectinesterase family protein [Pontibacter beigongshangensis]